MQKPLHFWVKTFFFGFQVISVAKTISVLGEFPEKNAHTSKKLERTLASKIEGRYALMELEKHFSDSLLLYFTKQHIAHCTDNFLPILVDYSKIF